MKQRIGLALSSGSARGWAHIGVIRALRDAGIEPDVVAGSSIGALVGAAYLCDQIEALEQWVITLTWWDIVRFMDIQLRKGGFIEGQKLMGYLEQYVSDCHIEELGKPFAAIATDLATGQEIWLQRGSLADAIRASIALPGLFTPVRLNNRWVVDGGLVNPVPVSVCRALGADVVIAVNLNGDIAGRHLVARKNRTAEQLRILKEYPIVAKLLAQMPESVQARANTLLSQSGKSNGTPGLFDVLADSINIMQDRITRSRMADDPPDVVITPRLAHIRLMEFDRAKEAIAEGRACVEAELEQIRARVSAPRSPT
jgi:NTE family protein